MTDKFAASDYVSAFQKIPMSPYHLKMLQANYNAPNRTLTATMMAKAVGYNHYSAANLHYGRLGSMVGELLGWTPLPKIKIKVLVTFDKPGLEWLWILRPEVAEALEDLGWTDANPPKIPEEVDENESIYEGAKKKIYVNAYERSSVAREKCLLHHGFKCVVCGIVLSDVYGEIAREFMHVHHLIPLAQTSAEYEVNPVEDLRPVCPTCHAIIHRKKPPLSVEKVREFIEVQRISSLEN